MDSEQPLSERAAIAREWTEEQHAVAWQVASYVDDPKEAAEVMSMLGLWDEDPKDYKYHNMHDPKGAAVPENGNARKSHYS